MSEHPGQEVRKKKKRIPWLRKSIPGSLDLFTLFVPETCCCIQMGKLCSVTQAEYSSPEMLRNRKVLEFGGFFLVLQVEHP
jgi:hypothetical protein